LTFLTAAMSFNNMSVDVPAQVHAFAFAPVLSHDLVAISVAAVFFGAMTYIGNGPNFMVKSIVEEHHREMPSFAGYVTKYALPILIPVLVLVWFLFIR
jgi:Na+/H+ antiporter NhaD/arsenite permease-like protein